MLTKDWPFSFLLKYSSLLFLLFLLLVTLRAAEVAELLSPSLSLSLQMVLFQEREKKTLPQAGTSQPDIHASLTLWPLVGATEEDKEEEEEEK